MGSQEIALGGVGTERDLCYDICHCEVPISIWLAVHGEVYISIERFNVLCCHFEVFRQKDAPLANDYRECPEVIL